MNKITHIIAIAIAFSPAASFSMSRAHTLSFRQATSLKKYDNTDGKKNAIKKVMDFEKLYHESQQAKLNHKNGVKKAIALERLYQSKNTKLILPASQHKEIYIGGFDKDFTVYFGNTYNLQTDLRPTCRTMANLFETTPYLRKMKNFSYNSHMPLFGDVEFNTIIAEGLAFSFCMGDTKKVQVLCDTINTHKDLKKYQAYSNLLIDQMVKGRKETVKALVTEDPFSCKNQSHLFGVVGPLLDDINGEFDNNNSRLQNISTLDRTDYIAILINAGCKTRNEIEKQ